MALSTAARDNRTGGVCRATCRVIKRSDRSIGLRGAAVTFLDENFSERRVVNPESQAARERLPFVLANGQEALVEMGEVVPQDVARTALRYFFENGQAPSTFTYREAK